jgi:hypothetical protein
MNCLTIDRSKALLLCMYFFSLSLIQTQWAYFLSYPAFILVILVSTNLKYKDYPFFKMLFEKLITMLSIMGLALYSRVQLDSFHILENLDDLFFGYTKWAIAAFLIPTLLMGLVEFIFHNKDKNEV